MKFHIVQVNESVQDISKKYNVSQEEIIKLNRHINNIDSIVPGMKIRLPVLSDEVSDELKDNFLDIEKYYPKMDDFKEVQTAKKNDLVLEEEKPIDNKELVEKQPAYYGQPAYSYQPYPQQQLYQPAYYQNQYIQQPQPSYPYAYYQPPVYNRTVYQPSPNVQEVKTIEEKPVDLTISHHKEKSPTIDQKFFEQPAFSNPPLLNGFNQNSSNKNYPRVYEPLFQNPLFNPPYPCGKPIEEIDKIFFQDSLRKDKIENGFDDNVKEIKLDLREYVKKNTKISKKKDTLDIL
ncbi:LysM peptidoglycan-binding domain-containing protein [Mycoplasmatota bacterium]|nr:LysM peptidoglycan-binding domain-containing protein [Mycoplasmatota bacterium]